MLGTRIALMVGRTMLPSQPGTFVAGQQLGAIVGANFSGCGSVNGTTQTATTATTHYTVTSGTLLRGPKSRGAPVGAPHNVMRPRLRNDQVE
jgi:hypothetical protein